jgi:hypothetical protein
MIKPIAILCSDLHLSSKAPTFRAPEPDWFLAMSHPILEMSRLAKEHKVPVICAGDVFDIWNSNAKLINFAIDNLPPMWCVPGQHDLPYHDINLMDDSSYGTLVRCGKLKHLTHPKDNRIGLVLPGNLHVWGFPWGSELQPCPMPPRNGSIYLAVAHKYCWDEGFNFPGCDPNANYRIHSRALKGFNVALFGDNHKGFLKKTKTMVVLNNGTFLRRKSDEESYKPSIGILMSDGCVQRHYLDTRSDKTLQIDTKDKKHKDLRKIEEFLNELSSLGGSELDYKEAVMDYIRKNKLTGKVKNILLELISTN